jgi:hypothetical protein
MDTTITNQNSTSQGLRFSKCHPVPRELPLSVLHVGVRCQALGLVRQVRGIVVLHVLACGLAKVSSHTAQQVGERVHGHTM